MTQAISASQQKVDFMNLLVTQMKNQDPLEPLNNQDMAAQLAQFSQLEQAELTNQNLTSLNSVFSKVLQNSELGYARSLVGSNVTISVDGDDAIGSVGEVRFSNDEVKLDVYMKYTDAATGQEWVDVKTVGLDEIKSVVNL